MQESLPRLAPPRTLRLRLEERIATRLPLSRQLAVCAAVLVLTTAAGWVLHDEFHLTPLLLCLVSSILLALFTDLSVALAYSAMSALSADYFFVGPVGDIEVDLHFLLRLLVFAGTSMLANYLVGQLRSAFVKSSAAAREAEEANREKDELLAILSHDLRAPLTAAQLSMQLIERNLPAGEQGAQILRHAQRARDACQRVNGLVLDLLDSSKAASGGLPIERAATDLVPVLRSMADELRDVSAQKGITLEVSEMPPELVAHCDAHRVAQVVTNLVGNALKFTPRGGSVRIGLCEEPGSAVLTVSDTGIGMTDEQCRHAFQRFWQAERSHSAGVGLGLFIVKAICDAHGGTVRVSSRPHQGTTFTVSLPL